MTITTSTSYKLPASVVMNASLMTDFVALHRFPEQFSYSAGNLAAAANVNLITGIADFRIVVMRVFWSFATTTRIELRDGTTTWVGWRTVNTNFLPIDLMPHGKVLGSGANFNMLNSGAAATDYDVTVFYTFERN